MSFCVVVASSTNKRFHDAATCLRCCRILYRSKAGGAVVRFVISSSSASGGPLFREVSPPVTPPAAMYWSTAMFSDAKKRRLEMAKYSYAQL